MLPDKCDEDYWKRISLRFAPRCVFASFQACLITVELAATAYAKFTAELKKQIDKLMDVEPIDSFWTQR